MKVAVVAAAAAALAGGVNAGRAHNHRHVHQALFEKRADHHNDTGVCVPTCTTIYSVVYGEATILPPPPKPTSSPVTTSSAPAEPTTTVLPTTTSSAPILVPTPIQQTCPTPGTYTFPATTVVLTETTVVCAPSTTTVPSGTHTLGGVTTVVETATTVTCPYATTKTENGVVTSVIETTTYVCPTPGTYTIAPITTTVTATETVVVVPVVTTYCPGTYTAPAVVTTITETNVVVYCPFTSPAPAPTFTPPAVAPPPKPQAVAPPPKPAPKPPAPKPVAPKPKPATGLGGSTDTWAMTYTPYRQDGNCKTAQEVDDDIRRISTQFEAIRIYSTDCDTLPSVGPAATKYGVKVIAGVFIGQAGCSNASPTVAEQIEALKSWGDLSDVILMVVGNEALFNGFCTPSELASLIQHVRSELGSVGYTGPITTTDVVSAWQGDVQAVCSAIDVVAANVHPYFNFETTPDQAGAFVQKQLSIIEEICGKPGYVLEAGWPKQGNCNGVACAGVDNQRIAIQSIRAACGEKTTFFSLEDDHWKKPGNCNCEQSWGCGQLFGLL